MAANKPASSRKRKQDMGAPLEIDVLPPASSIGPVFGKCVLLGTQSLLLFDPPANSSCLVTFPAIRPANRTSFKMYKRDRALLPDTPLTDQQTVFACETRDVEFYSINKDLADRSNEQFACE